MIQSDPASARQGFTVELPLDLSAVESGRIALITYLEPMNLDSKAINRIEVVLEELVSNVVRHAEEATRLKLSASSEPDAICICVEDDGAEFNPLEAPEKAKFGRLEEATLGGLGIPLIKRLAKSVDYERRGSSNCIRAVLAA